MNTEFFCFVFLVLMCHFIQLMKHRETETEHWPHILFILRFCLCSLLALPLSAGKYMSVCVNTVMRPFSRCISLCVDCTCVCVRVSCLPQWDTQGRSDQKGPYVRLKAVEIPSAVVTLVLACLHMCSSLRPYLI